jgi:ElaB/YqjD/DUF883 family membrane-anchored ribosome-binding protein
MASHFRETLKVNKDNFEGGVRTAVGQGERFVGSATDDKASQVKGAYDEVAGSAQSAWGSAKDAAKEMADSGSIPDMSRLREDIAKLTQTVSELAQKQVASSRDQVVGVVGAAGDSLSQSAAAAQDKFAAVEGDVEARIKKNPWGAVAVAGLIGLLIGKMS